MMTVVACQQLAPRIADLASNVDMSCTALAAAAAAGADIIVLPELVTSGYVFESRDEARSVAVRPDDRLFDAWRQASGPASVVVGGFAEDGADGNVYNSLAILVAGRPVTVYRKTHLWDGEHLVFTPGVRPHPSSTRRSDASAR